MNIREFYDVIADEAERRINFHPKRTRERVIQEF